MRLPPRSRAMLKWVVRFLFLGLFGLLAIQTLALVLGRHDLTLDHTTFDTTCGILFVPAALGLTILRRSPGPDPGRGGEMGAHRGPSPRR